MERRSRGEDVIYQKQSFPGHRHTVAQSEGVAQVPHSILSVESGLCRCVASAFQARKQGDGGPPGDNFPDRAGLIKSALSQPGWMQRNRYNHVVGFIPDARITEDLPQPIGQDEP